MRILHVGNYKDPPMHGVAHAIGGLAAAEAEAGHEVHIYSPQRDFPDEISATSAQRGVRLHGRSTPVTEVVDAHSFDVAHVHYLFEPKHVPIVRTLDRRGVPYVVSPHGALDPMEFTRSKAKRLKKVAYLRVVERRTLLRAAAVRCVSDSERSHVEAAFPSVRAAVIPNCVSAPAPLVNRPPAEVVRIGYLGRLDPYHKGLDALADVQKDLAERGLPVEVALAGRPTQRDGFVFERFMEEQRDLDIQLVGPVHGDRKWSFLCGLTLYAQLSRWELFGISMIEAMLAGTPVLASASCDLAAELAAEDLAIVADGDARRTAKQVAAAIQDCQSLAARARRAQRWAAENFAPQVVADRTSDLYREAVSSCG